MTRVEYIYPIKTKQSRPSLSTPSMAPKPVLSATISTNPDLYEEEHVHAVYNDIAAHFSSTRYKV